MSSVQLGFKRHLTAPVVNPSSTCGRCYDKGGAGRDGVHGSVTVKMSILDVSTFTRVFCLYNRVITCKHSALYWENIKQLQLMTDTRGMERSSTPGHLLAFGGLAYRTRSDALLQGNYRATCHIVDLNSQC